MTISRDYNCSDMKCLVVAATIDESFLANKEPLIAVQSSWVDPYGDDLRNRIDAAGTQYIGIDYRADLRNATRDLLALQKDALDKLGLFKTQLEVNFDKPRYAELLYHFGFDSYYHKVRRNNQEALINLLMQIRQNMTDELKTEITAKGIAATLLDDLTAAADLIHAANIKQESLKSGTAGNNLEAVTEFNAIYNEIMAICKVAKRVFKGRPEIKAAFSFAKTLRALGK
ncbi:hypothetical protein KJ688_06510 [bacterium]|nr:hypothetical protein [bacterium]